ncbi:MAG TPA: hypothetical protein VGP94_13970 [Tepidisphaeraceae bacterium]|jgi:hypothetical protein|nr:hypothetical protein [Tepidisphaeraceae bacterium]
MKLDRNINADGRGKYGLIRNRRLAEILTWDGGEGEILDQRAVANAVALLERAGVIDWGDNPWTEFFVMRLRDKYAAHGLFGYAKAADVDDPEYAEEVHQLGLRSGVAHPVCKRPD